ncbi:MAG: hypothetical protein HYY78_05635 [Betaproteobacteria bacterium]|nr:hypothetical protein [Betaproteobacteria bacterium]
MEGNLLATECSRGSLAKRPALVAYVSRNAPVSIPEYFAIGFVDYDRTLSDRRCGMVSHESE